MRNYFNIRVHMRHSLRIRVRVCVKVRDRGLGF